ncbi:uncharacterized protein LOC128735364 [Sabethes cyaneus]|uniref:uncharacterized protein LOC128735364 n=1 Tax=Sabethes cyaneus TaxID=53552 RepID=UPI00237D3C96|nr:uncharacterized protein LOC128735364 [Sabethes cyaneus]
MTCECRPDFDYNPDDGRCHVCPGDGQLCTSCCFGGMVCHAGRCTHCWKDQDGECITQDSLFFLTAAQVALATAMVIGVSALATLLYKTFRARARNANQQTLESDQNRPRASRLSLSSIQIRVLRRLRDRPPKYETRHNYEFHQRERTGQTNQQRRHDTSPVSSPTGDPPPTYDGEVTSVLDLPPPYSVEPSHAETRIAIIGEQSVPNHDAPEGTLNDRSNSACSNIDARVNPISTDLEQNRTSGFEELKLKLDGEDEHKTVHI